MSPEGGGKESMSAEMCMKEGTDLLVVADDQCFVRDLTECQIKLRMLENKILLLHRSCEWCRNFSDTFSEISHIKVSKRQKYDCLKRRQRELEKVGFCNHWDKEWQQHLQKLWIQDKFQHKEAIIWYYTTGYCFNEGSCTMHLNAL